MQRYWWPGYERHLLRELQRQQNSTQFCDTLLQTEGISVPTHSCILAALSPYLCRKLSAIPSPPSGQKRLLQLQTVKAETLLKLVGLLYSGAVEVNGIVEQNDVLDVARLFGIRDLAEGDKNGNMKGELKEQMFVSSKDNSIKTRGSEGKESRKMQDAQVQVEIAGRTDEESLPENRNTVTIGTQTGKKDRKTSGHISDSRENTEELGQASGDGILGEEKGNTTEIRHPRAKVGAKNLANMKHMQQMLETTQISVKVRLRRRTKGEAWEIISPQDSDESLSEFPSHKQAGSNHKGLQTNTPPSTQEPDILIVQPQSKITCGCQSPSCDCFFQNQRDVPRTAPHSQPQGSGEESDEQIEKLLEDIMIGLNILPNLDCKKSHHLQPNHVEVVSIGQAPVTQTVSVPECAFCLDMGTQSGHYESDTVQNQQDTSLLATQPDAGQIQQQLPCSPQYHSSVRSIMQGEGSSCQKQHVLIQGQDNGHIVEYLPTPTTVEKMSLHTVSLPYMDDLRIPQCLSPLEQCTFATEHQAVLNQLMVDDTTQQQSFLHKQTWLTENPETLQLPQSAVTHIKDKTALLAHGPNCGLNQDGKQDFSLQNCGTSAEMCTVKQVGQREIKSRCQQAKAEVKSVPSRVKESLKCKQSHTSGDAIAPKKRKRMKINHLQDPASSLTYKDTRNSVRTKCEIKMSSCSVSLSSNNVLAKEREMATSSLNFHRDFIGKANPLSSTSKILKEKTKATTINTDQPRIRTRSFMKSTQHSASNLNPTLPVAYRATTVNINGTFPKRRRGRPKKAKAQDIAPPNSNAAVITEKSSSVGCWENIVMQVKELQMANQGEQPLKNQEEDEMNTQNPDLLDVGGMNRTPICDNKEEEEEVEVDVLFLSPERTPRETGPAMEILMDEEDDDVTDIDVTGDDEE